MKADRAKRPEPNHAASAPDPETMLRALVDEGRLRQQLRFVIEIDRLKGILRRNLLVNGTRRENSAEHSWHQALMAMLLVEHADEAIDGLRVMRMLLIHDVVEIDAGDTFVYDVAGQVDKAARERAAADRIFGLLPSDQRDEMLGLWEEFEARDTPESRFAAALDRVQPLLHNLLTGGVSWQHHGVTADRVRGVNEHVLEGSPRLGEVTSALIATAVHHGFLAPAPAEDHPHTPPTEDGGGV
jgi:putative hydrolase of HD superfamily